MKENNNIYFEDILNELDKTVENNHYLRAYPLIMQGIKSLRQLDDSKKKKVIDVYGRIKKQINQKDNQVRTLFSTAIYLDKYFKDIESLNYKELSILSYYSSFSLLEEYEVLTMFYTKNILKEVVKVSKNIDFEHEMLVEIRDQVEKGMLKSEEEIISFVRNNPNIVHNYEDLYKTTLDIKL